MPAIQSGQITAYYLFDVAEAIDPARVPGLLRAETALARLAPKPVTPAYVQYQQPPLVVDGEALQMAELDGFKVRFKLFDCGVVSLALTRPFSGSWVEKLKTLDDIYRFAVEQTGMSRGHFLELTIVLILVFELILFFMGIAT